MIRRVYFYTQERIAVPAVTTEQMIEIDRIAMEKTGPNLWQMMENAGRNLALFSIEFLGTNWQKAKIAIIAGTGGNGGGGICAARHLANRNLDVSLVITKIESLKDVPAFQYKIFRNTAGKEITVEDFETRDFDVIIDTLIGYGLSTARENIAAKLIELCNEKKCPVISLDAPSGINLTTGEAPGNFIIPDATLTLALPKTGLVTVRTGSLFVADIGIPESVFHKVGLHYISPFGNNYWVKLRKKNDFNYETH